VVVGGATVAVAAVLLSAVGTKNLSPKQSLQTTGRPAAVSEKTSGSSGESSTPDALSRDDRGPWYALCQEFVGDLAADERYSTEQVEEVERTVKDEKGEHKFTVRKHAADNLAACSDGFSNFRFLVATVPDPVASHLDVEFDRAIESLQRAAAFEGYSFERYWLPWRSGNANGIATTGSATTLHTEERLRQEQPGLLIFRKLPKAAAPKFKETTEEEPKEIRDPCFREAGPSRPPDEDQRLLIFLVGEIPTAGLNRAAFFKSLDYIDQLMLPPDGNSPSTTQPLCVSIAGPQFSATLPALGEAIVKYKDRYQEKKKNGNPVFHVVGYGARSDSLIEAFHSKLRAANDLSTFSSLDLTSSDAQNEIVTYLCDLGYENSEIAVLGEDGSAYGNAISKDLDWRKWQSNKAKSGCNPQTYPTEALYLSFPRDLSTIRNAMESESSSSETQQIAGVNIPSIGVTLSLRQDETNERDSPADFARNQSSARVDSALQAIVRRLRTRRIQAVIVTATNPLDRVFLLQYLHLTVPDIRLATIGADDFMLGRARSIDLSGTLAVTSLPLLSGNSVVNGIGGETAKLINFPSNASEGIFLAATNLLWSLNSDRRTLWVDQDAAKISECDDISIIGKTGFRTATRSTVQGTAQVYPCIQWVKDKKPAYSVTITRATANASVSIPFIWVVALTMLLAVTLLHLAFVYSSNGWLRLGKLPTVRYFSLSSSSVRAIQMFFLFAATCQIFLWEWIAVTTTLALYAPSYSLLLPTSPMSDYLVTMPAGDMGSLGCILVLSSFYQQPLLWLHIVLLACSCLVCGRLFFTMVSERNEKSSHAVLASIVVSLLFVVSTCVCWWLILCHGGFFQPQRLVASRAVYLLEGLSPIIPIFFVLLAYYLWSLNNLQRLSMVVARVSLCIPSNIEPAEELASMVTGLQASIRQSVDLKPALALMGLTILACYLLRLTSALRGFEVWFRGWLVTWGFGLLLLIIVAMLYRSWDVWSRLRKILHFLDAALLGSAFARVPKDLSSMRIWSFGGTRATYMVQVRTAELLQYMTDEYPATAGQSAGGASGGANSQNSGAVSAFAELRKMACTLESGAIVTRKMARDLSALLNSKMAQCGFLFDPEASAPITLWQGEKESLELYVAYRFVAFFRYVLHQLRNMLSFVIYGFACLVVGIAAYPFQGRESLGTLMGLVFVLLLGGVAVMITQMYRDPILRRLERPTGGVSEAFEIATKLIGVAGVPLLAVLASQFPSVAEVLLNWVRPLVEASH